MIYKLFIILVLSFIAIGCNSPQSQTGFSLVASKKPDEKLIRRGKLVKDSYLVIFDNIDNQISVARQYRNRIIKKRSYVKVILGLNLRLTDAEAETLSQDKRVAYIEQDRFVELAQTQSNPVWGLDRIDQRNLPLDQLFYYNNDGGGVHIYIFDSGIYYAHNEFGGRAQPFWDNMGDGQNGNDCFGHGTHVAAIAAGSTYGVAKQAALHSVRVFNCSGGNAQFGDIIMAMDYVSTVGQRPAIINMSFVYPGSSPAFDESVYNAIQQGISFVVAAGNSAMDACNFGPGMNPNVINVGATWDADGRMLASNYGACVSLFAPGYDVLSANIGSPSATAVRSGTSMAAPYVTGTVALYLNTVPYANQLMVKNAMVNNATPDVLTEIGTGSPNKLLYLTYGTGTEPTPTPTTTPTATPLPTPTPCPSPRLKGKPCRN